MAKYYKGDSFKKSVKTVASVHAYSRSRNSAIGSNYRSLQTDNKPNFGAGGNRKAKVSLPKVKFMEGEK